MEPPAGGEPVRTADFDGQLFRGLGPEPGPGVLVLHGGGGAGGYEQQYANMLAHHGFTVLCVEYFGAPHTRDALVNIPLEEFEAAAHWLLDRPDVRGKHVGIVGFSRGGELALLVGSYFDIAGVVVAYVPSCYVWVAPSWMDGVEPHQPSWTLDGEPLPFLDVDVHVDAADGIDEPFGEPPNASTLAVSRASDAERQQARIPVEAINGPVLLVSGGKDRIWPAADLAERAASWLADHDHRYRFEHRSFPHAGHAIRVPYQLDCEADPHATHRFGGTHAANAHAAASAWEGTVEFLTTLK